MESQSRIFKVIVKFQEKDEIFYTRIRTINNFISVSLHQVIVSRYPSLEKLINRCYVVDKCGGQFTIINNDDLLVFIDGEDLFTNEIHVEIEGVTRNRETSPVGSCKRPKIDETAIEDELAVHLNVICDCCDTEIRGFRYKCTECYNFDLCGVCEGKMRHKEHMMLRIPAPCDRMNLFKDRHCRAPKWFKKESTVQDAQPEGHKKHHKKHHKHHHHHKHHPHHGGFAEFFKAIGVECPMMSENDSGTDAEPAPPTARATGNAEVGVLPDFQKLVKAVEVVAGNVSKIFDPLGISVPVVTPEREQSPTVPSTNEQPSQSEKEKEKTPQEKEKTPQEKEKTPQEKEKTPQEKEKTPQEKEKTPESEVDKVKNAFIDLTVSSPSAPEPFIPTTEEQILDKDLEMASAKTSKSNSVDGDAEWMVIEREGPQDDEEEPASQASSSAPKPEEVPIYSPNGAIRKDLGYGELAKNLQKDIEEQLKFSTTAATQTVTPVVRNVPIVPVQYHPIKYINDGIQQMIDMGFSNEGNHLTNLMVSCNGDINKCLNILARRM